MHFFLLLASAHGLTCWMIRWVLLGSERMVGGVWLSWRKCVRCVRDVKLNRRKKEMRPCQINLMLSSCYCYWRICWQLLLVIWCHRRRSDVTRMFCFAFVLGPEDKTLPGGTAPFRSHSISVKSVRLHLGHIQTFSYPWYFCHSKKKSVFFFDIISLLSIQIYYYIWLKIFDILLFLRHDNRIIWHDMPKMEYYIVN